MVHIFVNYSRDRSLNNFMEKTGYLIWSDYNLVQGSPCDPWGGGCQKYYSCYLNFFERPTPSPHGYLVVNSLAGQNTSAEMADHNISNVNLTLPNYKPGSYGSNSLLILSAPFSTVETNRTPYQLSVQIEKESTKRTGTEVVSTLKEEGRKYGIWSCTLHWRDRDSRTDQKDYTMITD